MDHTIEMIARQQQEQLRRHTGRPAVDREPLRRRAARSLHHLARAIDTDDI